MIPAPVLSAAVAEGDGWVAPDNFDFSDGEPELDALDGFWNSYIAPGVEWSDESD